LRAFYYEAPGKGPPFAALTAETTIASEGDGLIYDPAFSTPLHLGSEFEPLQIRRGWVEAHFADNAIG